jgi:hypothetical protein
MPLTTLPGDLDKIVLSYLPVCCVDGKYNNSGEISYNTTHLIVWKTLILKDTQLHKLKSIIYSPMTKVICQGSMDCMFYKSPFNGDISQWDISQVTDKCYMITEC